KVVAFGGRTLHNHHAKYINSPESAIYHKRKTIYGLAQAKREIAKLDKCFIVEGYADVISMHQAGFKNVIATSGTALTKEHIYTIRNLTNNVTELFDGDEAGIKAAIKGVDMLLKQDLNIKVLVLPSPEDPDSFAQNHSASEITDYINQNEQDFIDFKTDVLLKDCERDPIARAKAIESVLRSVANIPNQITRNVYAQVCVNKFHLSESVIVNQIERYRAQIKEEDWKNEERERKQRELDAKRKAEAATTAVEVSGQGDPLPPPPFDVNIPPASYPQEVPATQPPVPQPAPSFQQQPSAHESALQKCEYEVIQYMVKYGCSFIFEYEQLTVIEWLTKEITDDNHRFTIPLYQKLYKLCQELFSDFTVAFSNFMQSVEEKKHQLYTQEIEQFRSSFEGNVAEIERKEEEAKQSVDAQFENEISEYRQDFIFKHLSSHPDDDVREIVNEICLPKHSLSKIHAEIFSQHMDSQRLLALVSASLFNWKLTIIEIKISQLETELKSATIDRQFEILKKIQELTTYRKELAKLTGERVVNPKNLN
ncbi:MAG: toprim domain-containing protein, partial [Sodaliphilus sp.]|nr:toprim domain-containing protein [Sodaliphilus sp.]